MISQQKHKIGACIHYIYMSTYLLLNKSVGSGEHRSGTFLTPRSFNISNIQTSYIVGETQPLLTANAKCRRSDPAHQIQNRIGGRFLPQIKAHNQCSLHCSNLEVILWLRTAYLNNFRTRDDQHRARYHYLPTVFFATTITAKSRHCIIIKMTSISSPHISIPHSPPKVGAAMT